MSDCLFCKIIKGEIPNYTVYEDSHILAFLDINPHALGHAVVVPKIHAETLQDLNDELVSHLFLGLKKATDRIEKVLNPDGFNIGWNHGEIGGQVIPHLHIHIMPRFKNDGGGSMHSIINNTGGKTVEEIAKLFLD